MSYLCLKERGCISLCFVLHGVSFLLTTMVGCCLVATHSHLLFVSNKLLPPLNAPFREFLLLPVYPLVFAAETQA
jgi:hypothetical protein